jgi:catecholate siderophore receptor
MIMMGGCEKGNYMSIRFLMSGILLGGALVPSIASAQQPAEDAANTTDANASPIIVTGVRSLTVDKIPEGIAHAPQSITVISHELLEHQATSRVQDALKNVPGITFNAGEGGARGDTVNLRGFPAFNDFFLDGIRDAAIYSRDSFNLESIEVLKGPSAVLFGRGSTGGVVNQVSKAPTRTPLYATTLVGGTNNEVRATADIDQPIGSNAAIRINAMGEHSEVADRDLVRNRRWGIAPSISVGIGGPDTLTIEYLHQEENDIPDVGIPFVNGRPANVSRNFDYGLATDRFKSNVDIATGRYRHEFSNAISISNTLRYADYHYFDRFNGPNFGYVGGNAPGPTTPLDQILVGRDTPSSSGHRTNLTNQTDVTANFVTGPISHTLIAGAEFGRERDNTIRYVNPFGAAGETPATPLLAPNPYEISQIEPGKSRAVTTAFSEAAYIIDTVHLGQLFDLTGGVRFDRFAAHYRPQALVAGVSAASLVPLDHVDNVWSPRASIVFNPSAHQRIYFSYGTSFDPSAEALSLNAKTANLGPVKAKSFELGAKADWLGGRIATTAALFRTEIDNAQVTDPDHPTALVLAGNQRVDGVELGVTGHLTDKWEITAGYTYLDGKTLASTNQATVGKRLANTARNAVNLWTEYEFTEHFELGFGGNYLGKRYSDFAEQAVLPSYVIVDAMGAWSANGHLTLRVNVNNLFNKLAWQNSYYASAEENHVIPAPGRTALFTAAIKY